MYITGVDSLYWLGAQTVKPYWML